MDYSSLLALIAANITSNGQNAITGEIVRNVLGEMVASLGRGYQFMGPATPTTNPGTPDQRVFYLAIEAGTYTYFGNIQVVGAAFLYWDTSWHAQSIPGGGGGGGGISSVGLQMPAQFVVSNSPLLTDGVIVVTLNPNYVIPTAGRMAILDDITWEDLQHWDLAYQQAHTHPNLQILNGITAQKIAQWDAGITVTITDTVQGNRIATITINGTPYTINIPITQVVMAIRGTDAAPEIYIALNPGRSDSVALPIATKTKAGIVSTGNQVFGGNKTFDRIYLGNSENHGMYIDFDDTLGAFRIHGDIYATGDIAAGE